MISEEEYKSMEQRGISREAIEAQLSRFAKGFSPLRLKSAASVGEGIVSLDDRTASQCVKTWNHYLQSGKTVAKFVPASGAASRMFKDLYAFIARGEQAKPETDFEQIFFHHIQCFAFFSQLDILCKQLYHASVAQLMDKGEYVKVAETLLGTHGMNYGSLPKGLLKFHRLPGGTVHTPVEEHLEEGAQYAACGADRQVNIHFTVSPEHRDAFSRLLRAKVPYMEKIWGVKYHITMSEQKSSTDTIAAAADGTPYRDSDGRLLLRPAGHGALLENLNEIDAHVIFIKNIDNVVPSGARHLSTRYKKVLAGFLVTLQEKIASHIKRITADKVTTSQLKAALAFVEKELFTVYEPAREMGDDDLRRYLLTKLNRPIRVCGMVKNEGEPGGGPYLAYNADGSYSPQVLEAAQIDQNDPQALQMMKSCTHFNPVDLVCYVKDPDGKHYDLHRHVDPETGLISAKSKDGVEFQALELPGLWNGAMSDWNTVFVEVPLETFNPVKTVNDLLRPIHCS